MDFATLGVLPRVVAGFRRDHPDVEVDLRYSWTARQRAESLGGEVDLGFLIGPFSADGVRTRTLHRQRYVAVLPDAHPLASRRGVTVLPLVGVREHLQVIAAWRSMSTAPALRRFLACMDGMSTVFVRLCSRRASPTLTFVGYQSNRPRSRARSVAYPWNATRKD